MENTNEKKILLSEERLSELGGQLSDLVSTIEMQNHVINFVPTVNSVKESPLTTYSYVYEALETFYSSNQKMIKVIDDISFVLQNLSDEKELNSLGETVKKTSEEGEC